ncbi:HalOD1 output domain-containing protein [Natronorubrum thiooxidans]|uniref:Halobacterial output domain-containing protein n=1 Tax=Natronorubrum thiooxidans TaxID=308853 RepID=A0A1N7ESF9_9EURY|nr:HalOD1 output domain-containing protein [Natronorubrum thiooxidans]SIR90885.1 hypothetical protein SAMN05421752_1053 [Natronorubrum thiooxidans]
MNSTGSSGRDEHCDSVTETIVAMVADAEDIDVLEVPPLWDVINPDALEAVFAPSKRDSARSRVGHVTFSYCGYEVLVEYGDSITVSLE